MSKHNKVNPDHYHQAGRLTPDDWARERMKQQSDVHEHHPPEPRQDQTEGSQPPESRQSDSE